MRYNWYIVTLLVALTTVFAGCQSKEEKAAELIKNELSKSLYDFDSYQPIETVVKEAKCSAFNDTLCWSKASDFEAVATLATDYLNEIKEQGRYMDIYSPSYYSSSYYKSEYSKYKNKREEYVVKANAAIKLCNTYAKEIQEMMSKLDTTKVIGWEVEHRFRCKTKGGSSTIANYRYVIDKNFKKVLLREDMDDDNGNRARMVIINIQDGWEDIAMMKEHAFD